MIITMPQKVKRIIETLKEAGYEAYVVGGCVRDSFLGRNPDDWDITTSALPMQVKALFPVTIDTGLQHGTVTILMDKETFEVTTYRLDGEYEDGRHPKDVTFTPSLEEDLKRRDFTINAMAYNDEAGLVDLFDGMGDIDRKLIRAVGDPDKRFEEDALRVMRAVRFSAQLGYNIETNTSEAIKRHAENLKKISVERIQVELTKLLTSDNPDYIRKAYELGITKEFLPELDEAMETSQNNPHHCFNVGDHTIETLRNVRADKILRLTMLFHDLGKPETKTTDEKGIDHFYGHQKIGAEKAGKILRRLRFDNDTIKNVSRLVEFHDYGLSVEPTPAVVRRAINKIGEDLFPLFLEVRRADMLGQSMYMREEKEKLLTSWITIYDRIIKESQCVSLKTLALDGKDVIALYPDIKGPVIGKVLSELLDKVLDDPSCNNRETLINLLKEIVDEKG
ncbi:MAG: CCA tRNA nucleotidyltransferase [Lachnospiraceae bacterium]|nr:CCA tRNA nucleotidyltransferase [Lachnospiraceae bacterium]